MIEVKTWPFSIPMEILITDNKSLQDLQKDFSSFYPYLKVEFYATQNISKGSPKSKLLNLSQAVSVSRRVRTEGTLSLHGNMTVAAFEKELWDRFGLAAQVFRQSGKMWIETTLTESWTLDRQNAEGYELSDKSA